MTPKTSSRRFRSKRTSSESWLRSMEIVSLLRLLRDISRRRLKRFRTLIRTRSESTTRASLKYKILGILRFRNCCRRFSQTPSWKDLRTENRLVWVPIKILSNLRTQRDKLIIALLRERLKLRMRSSASNVSTTL